MTPRRSRPPTFAMTTICRWTFSRDHEFGPASWRIVASAPSGTFAPDGVSMRCRPDGLDALRAVRVGVADDHVVRPLALEDLGHLLARVGGLDRLRELAGPEAVAGDRGRGRTRSSAAGCRPAARRRGRRCPGSSPWPAGSPRRSTRSWERSSPKSLTAMFARVPESMWSIRCEIGPPIWMTMPGDRREVRAERRRGTRPSSARFSSKRTSISAELTSCACSSSSARPVRRAVETPPGDDEEDRLDAAPEPVRLFERGAREGDGAQRERALVELRQEGPAEERDERRSAPSEQDDGRGHDGVAVAEGGPQRAGGRPP